MARKRKIKIKRDEERERESDYEGDEWYARSGCYLGWGGQVGRGGEEGWVLD